MVKVLFFGTPQVAVPFLEWLTAHTQVVGVVCRPDEPSGRGYAVTPPATKVTALEKKIPVFQPSGKWQAGDAEDFKKTGADIGIVVAYGRILPDTVFLAPRLGCVNIHFSLLPKYRGAAPIQWSLIRGETQTGVSAFWLEAGLDSGPIFHQMATSIDPADDAVSLRNKLIPLGLRVLEKVIDGVSRGQTNRTPQIGEPTFAPQLTKEIGRIDWTRPATEICNLIRGVVEWPGAVTRFAPDGSAPKNLKILKTEVATGSGRSGELVGVERQKGFVVQCGANRLLVTHVQPEGKKAMSAWDFWQGAHLKIGDSLG